MSRHWLSARNTSLMLAQCTCFLAFALIFLGAFVLPPEQRLGVWCRDYWWAAFGVCFIIALGIRTIDLLIGRHD